MRPWPSRWLASILAFVVGACLPAPTSPGATPATDPTGAESLVWLATRSVEENDVTRAVRLTLGRGDGTVLWRSELPVDPQLPGGGYAFVSGPRNGTLAFAPLTADGGAEVRVVTAAERAEVSIFTLGTAPIGGVVAPAGDQVFLAHADTDAVRITRVTLQGQHEEVVRLPARDVELRVGGWPRVLDISPDGTRLVVQLCGAEGCRWQVVDLAGGGVVDVEWPGSSGMVNLTNDLLLATAGCGSGPCPHVLVDLATGVAREVDLGAHSARLAIDDRGRSVILHDTEGLGGGLRITAQDPRTGAERVLALSDPQLQYGLAREGQGDWAPPGWFVAAPSGMNVGEGGLGPALVRIADGLVVQLPPFPEP